MEYWINSNSGDYVRFYNNQYQLTLISRIDENGNFLMYEVINLTISQFNLLKGFVPIKRKKLFNNKNCIKYAPTIKGGTKGVSKRIEVLDINDSRDRILKQLGL